MKLFQLYCAPFGDLEDVIFTCCYICSRGRPVHTSSAKLSRAWMPLTIGWAMRRL